MNARRIIVATVVVSLLVVGVSAVAAQGGNGPGPGTGACVTGEPCPLNQNQTQMGGMFGRGAAGQMGNGAMGMNQAGNNGYGPGPTNCPMGGQCANMQAQMQAQMGNAWGMGGRWGNAAGAAGVAAPLTDEAAAAMAAGWLDEANAHAAYAQLVEQFGEVVPFVQLMNAEAQHMSAWERQFTRFGLALPAAPAAVEAPVYATVQDACAAAVAIEEANIGLYDEMLATFEGYPSLTQVTTALRAASVSAHLPALQACAAN